MNKKYRTIILFSIITMLLFTSMLMADNHNRKVVMVVIPGISLNDLLSPDLPNIRKLIDQGAIGMMNSRTAGRPVDEADKSIDPKYAPESGYLTLGAGSRAMAGIDARNAYNRNTMIDGAPAYEVLKRRTLFDAGNAEIVHIGIAKILKDNSALNYEVMPGALGKLIHDAGLSTAVAGNSDDAGIHREVATIPMDEKGLVDYGNIDIAAPGNNSGLSLSSRTDIDALINSSVRCIEKAALTVVEIGDTGRIERYRQDMMDAAYTRYQADSMRIADNIIGRLAKSINTSNTTLIILSPYPQYSILEKTGNTLCPIIVSGAGATHGLLTSGSTRVRGVISNIDIAPSILSWLNIPSPSILVGRPISVSAESSPSDKILELNNQVSIQSNNLPVLRQIAVGIIILIGIVTLLWFTISTESRRQKSLLTSLILVPSAIMPALLLTAFLPYASRALTWVFVLAVTAIIILVSLGISKKPARAFIFISLFVTALITIDLLTGSRLCSRSIIGYSVVDGSRYYGVGNEIMGVLIGAGISGLVLFSGWMRWNKRVTQLLLLTGLTAGAVIIGAPWLGANTGGTISVISAFGIALVTSAKSRPGIKGVSVVAICVISILALLITVDMFRGVNNESHMGRAAGMLTSGGFEQILMMIKRKLAMNILLIRMSAWSRLMAAYITGAVLVLRTNNTLSRLRPFSAPVRITLAGILSGTIVAFVFNDSGVVAAGTCIMYAWTLIMLLAVEPEGAGSI